MKTSVESQFCMKMLLLYDPQEYSIFPLHSISETSVSENSSDFLRNRLNDGDRRSINIGTHFLIELALFCPVKRPLYQEAMERQRKKEVKF